MLFLILASITEAEVLEKGNARADWKKIRLEK
jgi:hypothetical protein